MITTVVGNYPKVSETTYGTKLIGTISKWQRKEVNDQKLEDAFQEITKAVIQEQEAAGIELLTDGQLRWEDLVTPIAKGLEGFEINGLTRWFNNNTYYRRPVLNAAPKRKGPILVEAYTFAASCTKKPVKAVLPGPYTFARVSEDRHFKSERRFVLALAEILNEEAIALAKAGASVVQFDEPSIGFGDFDEKLALEALAVAVKDVPAKTAVYTYFSKLNGTLEGLMRSPVDIVGMDVVSDPTAISALKNAKITKELGLGCLDGRNTKLESVTELHALFDLVSKHVSLDRVHVGPNCGLEFLPHPQAQAKMKRLSEAVKTYISPRRA